MTSVADNLANIKKLITVYEQQYGRESGAVQLLAASKSQPLEKILAAYQAGQRRFGENYLQEALKKMSDLAANHPGVASSIEWHFIGPMQRNKTRKIAEHFAWVHSVDSDIIAKRLSEQRPAHLPPLNICIEVNISNQATKSGVPLAHVLSLAKECLTLPRLTLRGLMAIPAFHPDFNQQRQECHQLFLVWQALRDQEIALDTLSLGMSSDFEAAIAEGSTLVRIGSAIFGQRA